MQIPDQGFAEDMLLRLNYYRFSGYAYTSRCFRTGSAPTSSSPGTSLEAVVRLYEFDTQLRALLFRYIEPVEIAFRAAVCL